MRQFKILFIILATLAWLSSAAAANLAGVVIVDRTSGERLPIWQHGGRYYVVGQPGHRYSVELNNRSDGRVLAVLSVDGVNVVSGQTAASHQSGYVLDPWLGTVVTGWRKNMDEVAAFYFTSLSNSYAARTGRPGNVGVIGVSLFREYQRRVEPPVALMPAPPRSMPSPSLSESASPQAKMRRRDMVARGAMESLGTGHGERLDASATYTDFQRASTYPEEVIAIYYDSYDNLVASGIIPGASYRPPRPFPGDFVPDPR